MLYFFFLVFQAFGNLLVQRMLTLICNASIEKKTFSCLCCANITSKKFFINVLKDIYIYNVFEEFGFYQTYIYIVKVTLTSAR